MLAGSIENKFIACLHVDLWLDALDRVPYLAMHRNEKISTGDFIRTKIWPGLLKKDTLYSEIKNLLPKSSSHFSYVFYEDGKTNNTQHRRSTCCIKEQHLLLQQVFREKVTHADSPEASQDFAKSKKYGASFAIRELIKQNSVPSQAILEPSMACSFQDFFFLRLGD